MTHPNGIEARERGAEEGISDADIDKMLRKNPTRLLGIDG
jgi:predicted metal-dependent phosphotriesterase family hydrolase